MQHLVAGTRSIPSSYCCNGPQITSFICSSFPCTSYFGNSCWTKFAPIPDEDHLSSALRTTTRQPSRRSSSVVVSAFFGLGGSKGSSAKAAGKGCFSCAGKGAIECQGCKGTGKNKKNGNMFERWKCYDCQGFGLVGCPKCGSGGLTPEQRGER